MEKTLAEYISDALSMARKEPSTRENSLVITKLEEALMWHNSHKQRLQEAARRIGFQAPLEQSGVPSTPPTT